jgi:hypothetical protein
MPALAFWITAALLALGALALLAWALLYDRARGQPRCPRCWYAMSGLSADAPRRCPECGLTTPQGRDLYRTRRRWRWAALSMLLLTLSTAIALYPHSRSGGWKQLLPATAVIGVTYLTDDAWPFVELRRRTQRDHFHYWTSGGTLWQWQWRWTADRCNAALKSSDESSVKSAAMIMLFTNNPYPRRGIEGLTVVVNDDDPKIAQQAAWGIKGTRFDLHPLPEETKRALAERAELGPDPRINLNWAQLTLDAFEAIPDDWARRGPREPPPRPDEIVERLSGALAHQLATVHHELGVRSNTLTWAYNGEAGPFQVKRFDPEFDGQTGDDCVILVGDHWGSHWHALVYTGGPGNWRFRTSLDLPNTPLAPPTFRAESCGDASWLVLRQINGHGRDFQLWRDVWFSFQGDHPHAVLDTKVGGHGRDSRYERKWEFVTGPPRVNRQGRDWLIDYPAEIIFAPGDELWAQANEDMEPVAELFSRSANLRFVSTHPTRPFHDAHANNVTQLSTVQLDNMILGYPHEFIAANLDDLLDLARTGSPEIRAYLHALVEKCSTTPEVLKLRDALDEKTRTR